MKLLSALLLWLAWSLPANGEGLQLATAANFKSTLERLVRAYPRDDVDIKISSASTGTLYAQIRHGAPYDLFLAADATTPQRLVGDGLAVAGTIRTYALGQLVLAFQPEMTDTAREGVLALLQQPDKTLALANPDLAPYGKAAQEVLARLPENTPGPQLLQAANILQAYQMWFSGGADLALVAASQAPANHLVIPTGWHTPLRQQAVVLVPGANKPAARAFLDFLSSPAAHAIIQDQGYRLEGDPLG